MSTGKSNIGFAAAIGELIAKQKFTSLGRASLLLTYLIYKQTAPDGLCFNGNPFSYRAIARDLGSSLRTLSRHATLLRKAGEIKARRTGGDANIFQILNPVKWASQRPLSFAQASAAVTAGKEQMIDGNQRIPIQRLSRAEERKRETDEVFRRVEEIVRRLQERQN